MDLISTGLKTAGMLCIVIGMLILVLYFMKRFIFQKNRTKGDLTVRTLASLYLTAKERVEVIQIAEETIVLGVAPGSINYLTRLNGSKMSNQNQNPDEPDPKRK